MDLRATGLYVLSPEEELLGRPFTIEELEGRERPTMVERLKPSIPIILVIIAAVGFLLVVGKGKLKT